MERTERSGAGAMRRLWGWCVGPSRAAGLLRFAALSAVAFAVWFDPRKGIQDAVLIAGVLWGLTRLGRGWPAWKTPAGCAFLAVAAYALLTLPFGVRPGDSLAESFRVVDLFLFAFVMPALFPGRRELERALLYTASALTVISAFDLVRLAVRLKGRILRDAHGFEPFILGHSNVSSMVSGAALMILLYFLWTWRRDRLRAGACALAALVHAAYQVVMASRGPQLALAVTGLVAGLLLLPGWRLKTAWAVGALAVGAALVLWLNPRFKDSASMEGVSGRDIVWAHTLKLSMEHPVIGHGIGRRVFREVYHHSDPPSSWFEYWHPHQYWLYVLFAQGIAGVALHAAAWLLLARALLRRIAAAAGPDERALPALALLLMVFIHVYGLADWPSNHIHMMLVWTVPAGLVLAAAPPAGGAAPRKERGAPCPS